MKAHELCAVPIQGQRLTIGAYGPPVISHGGRCKGGSHRRRPVEGVLPGRFQVGFHGPVQEVVPPAAVDMHVDESRGNVLPAGIDHPAFRSFSFGNDSLDPAVGNEERQTRPDSLRQQQPASEKDHPHSLTFSTSPASRATVSFQSSV